MQKLTRFKILHIASLTLSFCMAVFLAGNILMQLNSAYKVYKAISSTASSLHLAFSDAALSLSLPGFNGNCALSMELSMHETDGVSQTLYAFVDKLNAGFSVGEKEGPYYTIPSNKLTNAFGTAALATFIILPQNNDIQTAVKKGINIAEGTASGNANLSFDKTNIQKAVKKLMLHTTFLAPQTAYAKKDGKTAKIVRHSFKIRADALRDFVASLLSDGISYADNPSDYNFSRILNKIPGSPDAYYSFCAQTDGERLCLLQCTAPRILGDVYSAAVSLAGGSTKIEFSISNLTDCRELLSVLISVKSDKVYLDANYFPPSASGRIMTLKLDCDKGIDASLTNSVSIYKMTLGELLELGRKADKAAK